MSSEKFEMRVLFKALWSNQWAVHPDIISAIKLVVNKNKRRGEYFGEKHTAPPLSHREDTTMGFG